MPAPAISSSIFCRASEISSRFTVSTLAGSCFVGFVELRFGCGVTVFGGSAAVSLCVVRSAVCRAAVAFSGWSGVCIMASTSESTEPWDEMGAAIGGVR